MKLALIAAVAKDGAIGKDGEIPWHFPEDMKRFKELTFGSVVIMGRKTHQSIGHALRGRINIVVTHQVDYKEKAPDCVVIGSFDGALAYAKGKSEQMTCKTGEVFCIGGAEIYRQAMPHADRIYLTRIDREYKGDAFFPEINMKEWRCVRASGTGPHYDKGEKFFAQFLEFDRSKVEDIAK